MEQLKVTMRSYGNMSSDCTSKYEVKVSRPCTLEEFIHWVLTQNEWGHIEVRGWGRCEYSGSKVIHSDFGVSTLEREIDITTILASGGWSAMNYRVELK